MNTLAGSICGWIMAEKNDGWLCGESRMDKTFTIASSCQEPPNTYRRYREVAHIVFLLKSRSPPQNLAIINYFDHPYLIVYNTPTPSLQGSKNKSILIHSLTMNYSGNRFIRHAPFSQASVPTGIAYEVPLPRHSCSMGRDRIREHASTL